MEQDDTYVDAEGKKRIQTPFQNIIRWRKVIDPETGKPVIDPKTGEDKVESNARFVKWSDGSTQLLIGAEAFNVTEQDLSDRHDYLFGRHENCKGLMQGQKKISGKMAFTPANLGVRHAQTTDQGDRFEARQDEADAKVHRGDGSGTRKGGDGRGG